VPPSLGDLGLVESVNELVESIRYTQLLQVDFDHFSFTEEKIPENGQLMLYRIVQEGLNNIVKHAGARKATVVIQNNSRFLLLEIKDDGAGFDGQKIRKGLGLTNIKNRAELFGGKVKISATPGKGCTLKVSIPLNAQQEVHNIYTKH
jgi:signal transduction histidine kinase